jgi:hypothetical protein
MAPAGRRLLVIDGVATAQIRLPARVTPAETPPAQASSQKPAQKAPSTPVPDRRRWEIEAHLTFGSADASSGGKGKLPPAGAAFETAGGSASRRVTSWYVGDGAVLLNDVLKSFDRPERITALDPVITGTSAEQTTGNGFGFRVTHVWKPKLMIEAGVEYGEATYTLTSTAQNGLKAASDSFVTAFGGLAASAQGAAFSDPTITSAFTAANGTGAELFLTGALVLEFRQAARLRPYLVGGGGIAVATGGAEATLTGRYQFGLPSGAQVDETDSVTVRLGGGSGAIVLAGGGVKFRLWKRFGVQADARVLLIEHHVSTVVTTHPVVAESMPADVLWSNLTPGIQFSTHPTTGHTSNLTGPALDQFKTFAGSGFGTRSSLSVGGYFRF